MKDESLQKITVPAEYDSMRREIRYFMEWYNEIRPRTTLDGQTPNEVESGLRPANQRPRIEPRGDGNVVRHTLNHALSWLVNRATDSRSSSTITLDVRIYRPSLYSTQRSPGPVCRPVRPGTPSS